MPATTAQGPIKHGADGSYDFGDGQPWKWLTVGGALLPELGGLCSFTILGWACPSSLEVGSGDNCIAFSLNHDPAGFDLVHLGDGRLRLAVNEWPDGLSNDSGSGKLALGRWTFSAVTYDAGPDRDNVCWYLGNADTPATLDRKTTYAAGPTGQGSGPLTMGNHNTTLHSVGLDQQFRGRLAALRIFGSRLAGREHCLQRASDAASRTRKATGEAPAGAKEFLHVNPPRRDRGRRRDRALAHPGIPPHSRTR